MAGLVDYETDDEHGGCLVSSVPNATAANTLQPHQGRTAEPLPLSTEHTWKRTPGEVNVGEMMIVGGVQRKVISMELAMQKENAYRRKMEGLQKKICNETRQPTMTALDTRAVGIKRQAPPMDMSCSPPPFKELHSEQAPQSQPRMGVSCSPPNFTQLRSEHAPPSQPIIHFCKECNITCSGALNFQMHCSGRKHKAKLEEIKNQKNGVIIGSVPLECSLCKVPCMSEQNLREHLAGKKHAACVQAINAALKGKGPQEHQF